MGMNLKRAGAVERQLAEQAARPGAQGRAAIPLLERENILAYLLLAPAVLTLLVFVAYPFCYGIWLSLTNSRIGYAGDFVGLANFRDNLRDPIFRTTVSNTFLYTAVTTVFKLILGIAMALVLNNQFRGKRFARAAMLLPWIVPTVLSALAFKLIFDALYSPINWLLTRRWDYSSAYASTLTLLGLLVGVVLYLTLGQRARAGRAATIVPILLLTVPVLVGALLGALTFTVSPNPVRSLMAEWGTVARGGDNWQVMRRGPAWLGNPPFPMISLMIANIWRGVPFFGISLLAGLQTIPLELYEAASIDGAGAWQRFRRITLPLLRPVLTVVLLLSIILTFADFQLIRVLTDGGPANSTQVFATYAYQTGIVGGGYIGQGASISLFMFPLLMITVFAVLLSLRKE